MQLEERMNNAEKEAVPAICNVQDLINRPSTISAFPVQLYVNCLATQ